MPAQLVRSSATPLLLMHQIQAKENMFCCDVINLYYEFIQYLKERLGMFVCPSNMVW